MPNIDKLLTSIAAHRLRIQTLRVRHSDDLDFHSVSVWSLHEALKDAYNAGLRAGYIVSEERKESAS